MFAQVALAVGALASLVAFVAIGAGVVADAVKLGDKAGLIIPASITAVISIAVMLGSAYAYFLLTYVEPPRKLSGLQPNTCYRIHDAKWWFDGCIELFVEIQGNAGDTLIPVRIETNDTFVCVNKKGTEIEAGATLFRADKLFQIVRDPNGPIRFCFIN